MSKQSFEKFINPKIGGAKKKEAIRQEKKQVKSELREKDVEERKRNEAKYGLVTKESKLQATSYKPQETSFKQDPGFKRQDTREQTSGFRKPDSGEQGTRFRKPDIKFGEEKSYQKKENVVGRKPAFKKEAPQPRYKKTEDKQTVELPVNTSKKSLQLASVKEQMPLNKYVAHGGISGRREAAELVKAGHVTVNGDIVYEPGFKVTDKDKVTVKGKPIHLQKNLVYILINKPKDYITTAKDPEGRKTVFELVANATKERIYPVGRLDRNTTGVLLMTNDGELAQKLTHPSFEIKKVYEVKLDKPLVKRDFDAILAGVTLEDGIVKADSLGYVDAKDKSVIGIEIHSGRNRIVRRLFEHLGYDVKNLDRVMFANLTKKNVDRGKWRFLADKEVRLLKYLNQSFVRGKKEA